MADETMRAIKRLEARIDTLTAENERLRKAMEPSEPWKTAEAMKAALAEQLEARAKCPVCNPAIDSLTAENAALRRTNDTLHKDWAEVNAENARLRSLVNCLLLNDPDDMAADGVTVLMEWRQQARTALSGV